MKRFIYLKEVCIVSALTFCLAACSEQKAEPYTDTNDTLTNIQVQGSIQTH